VLAKPKIEPSGSKWGNDMRRFSIGTFTLLVTCRLLFAADDGLLEGEIFIVTAGAENIRLGLVEVKVFPEAIIEEYLAQRKSRVKEGMPDFDKELNSPSIQESDADDDATIATYRKLIAERKQSVQEMKSLALQAEDLNKALGGRPDANMRNGIAIFEGQTATFEKLLAERLKSKDERIKAAEARITRAKDRIRMAKDNWPTPDFWFQGLPEPKYSTRTNSDGKFRFSLSKTGKFGLAARATRRVGDTIESYNWFIWVSLEGKDSSDVILGNHNLMSRGSKDAVVSTKSES
jgi:hypothetical protein